MATTEQFSLRWNNFYSNLTSGFHELLEAAEMVDVTLAVEGHFLQAHKVVLSICSPYFKQMFKANPCKHPIVILNDVGHENMKDILQFMYMGEVSVLRENLSSFLRAAEILQVKGLTGDDPIDDPPPAIKQNEPTDAADREIYSITESAKQSDVKIMAQLPAYAHTPPQTSPVSLTKRQLKPTNLSTNSHKRPKCVDPVRPCVKYEDNVNELQSRDGPKPNIDYNSCDYPEPHNMNAHQNVPSNLTHTPNHNDIKDLSGKCAVVSPRCPERPWDARIDTSLTTMSSMSSICGGGSIGSMDLSGFDQAGKPETKPAKTIEKSGFRCEHCCKKFTRRDHLRTHEKNIHGSDAGPFKCIICEQLYKNTESLRKHISKFHVTNINELTHKVEVKT